jgi:cytoskeletal protein RodZ
MKAQVCMLAVSLALGVAIAQTTPASQTPASQTQDPQQKTAQTDSKTNAKDNTKANSATASGSPAEMKTASFKGVLLDMSCASPSSASAATAPADHSASSDSKQKDSANRSASDSGPNCPVSASTKEFGVKLEDGRTVRFDLVGNQRAQDAVKNDKGWSKDMSANKPIHAKISGVLNGDKLIVASIN